MVETWERWREPIEAQGLRFQAAEQYKVFPPPPPGSEPGPAEAAVALGPLFEEFRPDLVVSDILTLAPALAAELHGIRRATLVPHLYPVHQPAMPFFGFGVMPPRTRLGGALWSAAGPLLEAGLRRGRRELNATRTAIGLPPLDRFHGGLSEELVIVATFPELEYPREWPAETRVVGPLSFEIPHPDVELPPGDRTARPRRVEHGPRSRLPADPAHVRGARQASRVRVLATTNGQLPPAAIDVPANGRLVDWLSYSQAMPAADLVVCHGGHGTVCRALEAGKPLLVSPAVGDMAENGARVQWAGAGLMLPSRFRRASPLRWVVRELLGDPRYRSRTVEIGGAHPAGEPGRHASEAVEDLLARPH